MTAFAVRASLVVLLTWLAPMLNADLHLFAQYFAVGGLTYAAFAWLIRAKAKSDVISNIVELIGDASVVAFWIYSWNVPEDFFWLFYPAILIAISSGGRKWGIASTLLCTALFAYLAGWRDGDYTPFSQIHHIQLAALLVIGFGMSLAVSSQSKKAEPEPDPLLDQAAEALTSATMVQKDLKEAFKDLAAQYRKKQADLIEAESCLGMIDNFDPSQPAKSLLEYSVRAMGGAGGAIWGVMSDSVKVLAAQGFEPPGASGSATSHDLIRHARRSMPGESKLVSLLRSDETVIGAVGLFSNQEAGFPVGSEERLRQWAAIMGKLLRELPDFRG